MPVTRASRLVRGFHVCYTQNLVIPVFTATNKNMKKFVSEIFKSTRSGKLDAEEASHIKGCVKPNIKEVYKLTPTNSLVDYSDM